MPKKQRNLSAEVDEFLKNILQNSNHLHQDQKVSSNVLDILQQNILLGKILSAIMSKQREQYLNDSDTNDQANGFYPRKLMTKIAPLPLEVPRTRNNHFRPSLLPSKYSRHESSFEDLLQDLLCSGLTKSKIKEILSSQNLSFSEDTLDELSQNIEEQFKQVVTKDLPESLLFIIIDAKEVECVKENNRIGKVYIYQVLSIDHNANRDVIYFEVSEERENSKKWISVFSKLIERGLRNVFFIITDNLTGLSEAIKNVFPASLHQLCIVHLKRNIQKYLSKQHVQEFNDTFEIIKVMTSYQDAVSTFENICDKFMPLYPHFMHKLKQDAPLYVNFIRLPKDIRKYLYSTNLIEGLNNVIEQIRKSRGGYFRSSHHIFLCYGIWYNRFKISKWATPHVFIKANEREILSLYYTISQVQQ